MKRGLLPVVICSLLLMASCVPQKTLYNWGASQEAAYRYIKNNTEQDMEKLLQEYQKVVDNQKEGRKTVPPGIYADYGFFLVKQGKTEEGLKPMKMEVALYPESAVFIERIIKRLEEQ
jgi:hypothetical protein